MAGATAVAGEKPDAPARAGDVVSGMDSMENSFLVAPSEAQSGRGSVQIERHIRRMVRRFNIPDVPLSWRAIVLAADDCPSYRTAADKWIEMKFFIWQKCEKIVRHAAPPGVSGSADALISPRRRNLRGRGGPS
jgi:hypothetical protein